MHRDPKGLYAKAQAGHIKNFTGFDAPYERPSAPEVHLHTMGHTPAQLADQVLAALAQRRIITTA
jgi:bifunctional enzyme CysN/CysC